MTKDWEKYQDTICELYLDQGLTLEAVRIEMHSRCQFDASTRSYREKLREWNALKQDNLQANSPASSLSQASSGVPTPSAVALPQPSHLRPLSPSSTFSQDEGYGTDPLRASSSTLASNSYSDIASARDSQPISLDATLNYWSNPQSIPSVLSRPASVARTGFRGHTGNVWSGQNSYERTSFCPQQDTFFTYGQELYPNNLSNANPASTGLGRGGQINKASSSIATSSADSLPYVSPHASPSRCRRAHTQSSRATVERGWCRFCEASRAHYIASKAMSLDKNAMTEYIDLLQANIRNCDIFGNAPLHFLAGAGPTMEQLRLFVRAGADITKKNIDGETFLHVLNPIKLGNDLSGLLQDVHDFDATLLKQRTYCGKTVLRSILSHRISADLLISILPFFQSARNNINARDAQGFTAMEVFCANGDRTPHEWEILQGVLEVYFPDLRNAKMMSVNPYVSGWFENGNILAGHAPSGRFSGELTKENLEIRDGELRTIIDQAAKFPFVQDYRGRNGFHCLANIVCLSPNDLWFGQPPDARKQCLIDLLSWGVDVNEFDYAGSTPLHSFLTYPRCNEDETTTAQLVHLMIRGGADIHMRDRNGDTALHLACKHGRRSCTETLIILGASVDARNYRGRGIIAEATRSMRNSASEEADRIQHCIELVWKLGGDNHPRKEEDAWEIHGTAQYKRMRLRANSSANLDLNMCSNSRGR